MNRDDVIRMARQAGCHDNGEEFRFVEIRYLERFAALAAAAEREACSNTFGCRCPKHFTAEPVQEPDLSLCPNCGGPADNGHDRSIPPSPYWCTKCMAEPVQEPVAIVGTQEDVWRGYEGQWAPPGPPIKTVFMLRDLPEGTPLYTAPPQRKPLPLKEVERLIYEHTKINPNVDDDRELLGYIVNAVRAIERAHEIGGR